MLPLPRLKPFPGSLHLPEKADYGKNLSGFLRLRDRFQGTARCLQYSTHAPDRFQKVPSGPRTLFHQELTVNFTTIASKFWYSTFREHSETINHLFRYLDI